MKQIRLKDGSSRAIQRCWDCPAVHTNRLCSSGDEWFTCGLGTLLPSKVPLMEIKTPDECQLEDFGTTDLGIVVKKGGGN